MGLLRKGVSQGGNVAVLAAMTLAPIVSVVGLALDFHLTVRAKAKAQFVLDSVVIAAARHQQRVADADATSIAAEAMIADQLSTFRSDTNCDPAVIGVDPEERSVSISLHCTRRTAVLRAVGIREMPFSVNTEASWDVDKLEIAFVFDMSDSMAGNVADLQAAATESLDLLLPSSGEGLVADTRIAMVSYGDMVNAGELFEAATGFKPKRTYFAVDHYVESGVAKTRGVTYEIESTCVYERHGDFAFTDDAPDPTPPGYTPVITPVSMIDGVRIPRAEANGQYYNDPEYFTPSRSLDNPHGFIGAQSAVFVDNLGIQDSHWYLSFDVFECGDLGPLPLTDDRAALDNYLAALSADGLTAGHQGIAWGWYLLSNKWASILPSGSIPAPYTERRTVKALVLMTDGVFGTFVNTGSGNSKQMARAICDQIKRDSSIRIFAIGYEIDPSMPPDMAMLQYCASEPDFVFEASDSASLTKAYRDITRSLTDLRIIS